MNIQCACLFLFFKLLVYFLDEQEVLQGVGEVTMLEERSLTGTWDSAGLQRWKWKTANDEGKSEKKAGKMVVFDV